MKKSRDFQVSKVYDADDAAFDKTAPPEFETVEECRAFVDQITRSRWWRNRFSPRRHFFKFSQVRIKDGRGTRTAYAYVYQWAIGLPKWSRSRWVIIHELAHLLIYALYAETVPDHGREFCYWYLQMVRRFLGPDAADRLKTEFKRRRVKYTRRRK